MKNPILIFSGWCISFGVVPLPIWMLDRDTKKTSFLWRHRFKDAFTLVPFLIRTTYVIPSFNLHMDQMSPVEGLESGIQTTHGDEYERIRPLVVRQPKMLKK